MKLNHKQTLQNEHSKLMNEQTEMDTLKHYIHTGSIGHKFEDRFIYRRAHQNEYNTDRHKLSNQIHNIGTANSIHLFFGSSNDHTYTIHRRPKQSH